MAKAKNTDKEAGDQLDLIDVAPKNAKPIIAAARLYRKHLSARLAVQKKENDQKQVVLELVRNAKLQTLDGGKIKFIHDGVTISVEPRDALIKIEEKDE